jgi:UDP-glucose 4-epimerase
VKVVVTGGLGVVGVWVIRQLLGDGWDVVVQEQRRDFSLAPDIEGRVSFEQVDVTDFDATHAAIGRAAPDCVVHLAAVLPDVVVENPIAGFGVNVGGTLNVLEASRQVAVPRVVVTSSRAVYGLSTGEHATGSYVPIPETYPPHLPNAYGWTKVSMEAVVQCYREIFGLATTCLRFCAIYGPGRDARHGIWNLLSGMIEAAHRHEPFHIPSGGDQRNDLIFVEDVARGIVAAVTASGLDHGVYNISSGQATLLRDFVAATNEAAGGEYVTVGPGLDYFQLSKDIYGVMDNTHARESLGFVPKYSIPAGIRRYMQLLDQRA